MKLLIAYLAGLLAFFLIDIGWITLVVVDAYRDRLGPWIVDEPRLLPAVAFYLLYVGGLVLLAVRPALKEGSAKTALINGALLGAFGYGTYSLTNYAMLTEWSWYLAWTDIIWGVVLSALVALCAYLAGHWFDRSSRAE